MPKRSLLFALIVASILASMASVTLAGSDPATIKKPAFKSSKPIYLSLVLGEQQPMIVVIDESEGNAKGYDLFYLDQNRDGDLTNDPPIQFPTEKYEKQLYTTPTLRFTAPAQLAKGEPVKDQTA